MTSDEILQVVTKVFGGARVSAVVGYWNLSIETVPTRELILGERWVQKLTNGQMTANEFENVLLGLQDGQWLQGANGTLTCFLK